MKYSSFIGGLLLSGLLSLAWCEMAVSAPDLFGVTADVAEKGEIAPTALCATRPKAGNLSALRKTGE